MFSSLTNRRDPTLLLALLVALAVHGAILAAGNRAFRANLGWELANTLAQQRPTANIAPVRRPREADDELGEAKGTGKSINSLQGDVPMQSAVSDAEQEQAMASRDPTGFGKPSQARPLVQALKGSSGAKQAIAQPPDLTSPPAPKSAKPPPLVLVDPKAPANLNPAQNPLDAGPLAAKASPPTPPSPQPQQTQQQQQEQQNQQSAQPEQQQQNPSAAAPGGKPVPQANFESTPVTIIASNYVAGRIVARPGRKFIARELPDLTDSELFIDLPSLAHAVVWLHLKIGASGDVTDVQVERSCGSSGVDDACQRAAATWWFEPKIDPETGKAVPDEIDFAIRFK
jgi:TonB family protein